MTLLWSMFYVVIGKLLKNCYHMKLLFKTRVWLMCALRAHIKLFIFGNIFSEIEKAVITFSILEKFFSKNEN